MTGQLPALGDPRETGAFTPSLLLPRYVLLPKVMRSDTAPAGLSRFSASFSFLKSSVKRNRFYKQHGR